MATMTYTVIVDAQHSSQPACQGAFDYDVLGWIEAKSEEEALEKLDADDKYPEGAYLKKGQY